MTESLNRDEIIALLERLGGDDDADVLAAARALHAAISEAGTDWNDLLVPEDGGDPGADEPAEAAEPDGAEADESTDAAAEIPADASKRDSESLALIKKLLAQPGVSESFREEMEGYRRDIANGVFEDSDRRYLIALQKRLSAKN